MAVADRFMLINHKYRFVYLATPRTASSSIKKWLGDLEGSISFEEQHRTFVPEDCRDYFCWSSFRNPLERAASLCGVHQQDDDARDWPEFVEGLPAMHPFHSRSQLGWLAMSGQRVRLIRLGAEMEQEIVREVFSDRGHLIELEPIPMLNETEQTYLKDTTAPQAERVLEHWSDDQRAWVSKQQFT